LNFWNMKIGDLVIVGRGSGRRSHVVRITGKYEWTRKRHPSRDYMHQRAAVRTNHDADELWSRQKPPILKGQTKRCAVVQCK
jgi:hypothetical protein